MPIFNPATPTTQEKIVNKLPKLVSSIAVSSIALISTLSGCGHTHTEIIREKVSHLDMCLMYIKQKDYENSVLECTTATRQDPSAAAYSNLGVSYIQLGKNNLALNALKQAERLGPTDPYVHYNLASIYSLLDHTDLGLEHLDSSLRYGFKDFDSLRWDRDLDNLRAEPEFRKVLEKHRVFMQ
jgi:tetratricopeptide (TPR) repeat protein